MWRDFPILFMHAWSRPHIVHPKYVALCKTTFHGNILKLVYLYYRIYIYSNFLFFKYCYNFEGKSSYVPLQWLMSGVMMGCSYPYFPLESAIVPLNPNPLSLHILQWELAELWSRNPQRKSPIKQPCQINRREREGGKSVRLIWINRDALVIWPWLIHDLLLVNTGNGCLNTIYQRTTIEPENKRKRLWHRRSRGRAHGMWCAPSFTITENASYLYTTSCFCAVTVNFPKIFVLDCASPELRTKHSSAALNLTFNRWLKHSEAFDRNGFAHIIACFYFKTTG